MVEACRGNRSIGKIQGIVTDINAIRSTIEMSGVTWMAREANMVAHEIARLESK